MGIVAHFGTFDVENFGDLLFPVIFERRLADLGHAFVHVSPLGGLPVWGECVPTVGIEAFTAAPPPDLAAVVVGGGHIIHASPTSLPRYDQGGLSAILAYPGLWLGAAVIAAQHNVPYCWNAPGVAQPFSSAGARLVEWTSSIADDLAVRDHLSRTRLRDAGVTRLIRVVPDTALDAAHLWTQAELDDAFQDAFAARGRQAPERVVVIHLNGRYVDESPTLLAARLDRIAHRFHATPILIAMGPCHGDDELQREVGARMQSAPLVIDHPRSLREVASCLAHAQAYFGSSLHGMIVSCAFGVPGMVIVPPTAGALSKFLGCLEPLQLSRWISASWEAAEQQLDEFVAAPHEPWTRVLDATTPLLDEHWQVLRHALDRQSAVQPGSSIAIDKPAALERLSRLSGAADSRAMFYAPLVAEQAVRALQLQHVANAERQAKETALAEQLQLQADLAQSEVRFRAEIAAAREAAAIELRKQDQALSEQAHLRSRNDALEAELEALRAASTQEHLATEQACAERDHMRTARDRARKEVQSLRGHVLLRDDEIATALGVADRQVSLLAVVLERARGRLSGKGKPGKADSALVIAQEELARLSGNLEKLLDSVNQSPLPVTDLPTPDPAQNIPGRPAHQIAATPAPARTSLHDELVQATRETLPLANGQPHPADLEAIRDPVDIIVCIHNALDDVQSCLASVVRHTPAPYRLIVVDDGSDVATAAWLQSFVQTAPHATLLCNEDPTGYTKAANQGLRVAASNVMVLLNSDTIVTPNWLDHLLACLHSDPHIGIVGPLSNAASYQSVPERFEPSGDWALNPVPPGWDIDSIAVAVEKLSTRTFPRVSFVNGFCFAITRAVIEAIGYFDEEGFPNGYGEENDFCLRAADAGFALAIADQAYIYHAKSRSYSHRQRRALGRAGRATLLSKYGLARLEAAESLLRDEPHLATMRSELAIHLQAVKPNQGSPVLSVLFLLPVSGGGGGAHSVVQEASGMRRLGINAQVAVRAQHLARYRVNYPDISESEHLFFAYRSLEELQAYAAHFSVVVATIYTSMPLLAEIAAKHRHVMPAYYIQDYEPFFYPEGSPGRAEAARSYTLIPHAVLFAKTRWLCDTVATLHNVVVHKVSPSLDHAVYYPPSSPRPADPVRVMAMIRPSSPRRGARRTMEVLQRLVLDLGKQVQVHIFGCGDADLVAAGLPLDFPFTNHGVLTREAVAATLRESDIFLDLSDYQAFGRTGLEAMACGCAVVLPALGGTSEYAVQGENALLVDTSDVDTCFEAARALVADPAARQRLQEAGLAKAAEYSIEQAARSELAVLTQEQQSGSQRSRQTARDASGARGSLASSNR